MKRKKPGITFRTFVDESGKNIEIYFFSGRGGYSNKVISLFLDDLISE